jgi:PAS domain S-box-containing protein
MASARDLAQVLEHSGEAVIVKDLNAVVTYWNREAATLYGFSAEEAIGQPLRELHAAELSEADYASLLTRVRAGHPTSSPAERRKKNGEIVRVTLNTTPLLDEHGALVGEITIARDVTAMFQKEEALRRAERELRLHGRDSFLRLAVPSNPTEPSQIQRAPSKAPINEILIGVALLVSSCLSILLTRVPGGIALFWPGSAIAAALLIRLPRIRWISAVASVVAALLVANVVAAHRSWLIGALFTGVGLTEIAMMVAVFRAWRFPYPDITVNQAAIMTAIFGIGIPGAAAMGAGLVLHLNFAVPFMEGTLQWWSSHAIGACLLGPPIMLFSVKGVRRLLQGMFLVENVLTLFVCVVGCYLTIRYVRFPFVSLALLLLIVAFRMGGFGTSMMSLCLGLMIANLNGIWTYTNIALQQMLGYTAEEFRALPPGGPAKAEGWKARLA